MQDDVKFTCAVCKAVVIVIDGQVHRPPSCPHSEAGVLAELSAVCTGECEVGKPR